MSNKLQADLTPIIIRQCANSTGGYKIVILSFSFNVTGMTYNTT